MNLREHVLRDGDLYAYPAQANAIVLSKSTWCQECRDTLAERLRRRPAKPMGSPRVGSNPTGVVMCPRCIRIVFGECGMFYSVKAHFSLLKPFRVQSKAGNSLFSASKTICRW